MSLFIQLVKESRLAIVLSVLLSLVGAVLSILLISFVSRAISGELPINDGNALLFFLMVGLLFCCGVITQKLLGKLGSEIVSKLRTNLSGRMLSTSFNQLEKLGKSRIYTSLVEDINAIQTIFISIPVMVFNAFLVIGGIIYLGYLSVPYMAVFLCLLAVTVIVFNRLSTKINIAYGSLRNEQEVLHRNFHTLTDGARELSISQARRHYFYHNLLTPSITRSKNHSLQVSYQEAFLNNLMGLVVFIVLGILIFIFGTWYSEKPSVLSGFLVILLFIRNPIGIIIDSIPVAIKAKLALRKIQELEMTSDTAWLSKLDSPDVNNTVCRSEHNLEFNNVSYEYPEVSGEAGFRVGPLSLKASSGSITFITGGNGSGKSTFAKILTALYEPKEGVISFNGKMVKENNKVWYQSHLSVVFSDFFLFDFIVNNEGKGEHGEKIDKWLKILQLDKKVTVSQGYISSLKLSHGQRKRLALLASYIENTPIVLFDEWAADQDPVFRAYFYRNLLPLLKQQGKMLFVISHDEKYFGVADRLLRMDEGNLEVVSKTDTKTEGLFSEELSTLHQPSL